MELRFHAHLHVVKTRAEDLTGHTVHIDRRILDFVVGLDTALGKTLGVETVEMGRFRGNEI